MNCAGKKTPGGAGTHTGHTGAHRSYRVQYRMRHGALRQAPRRARARLLEAGTTVSNYLLEVHLTDCGR